MKVAFVKQSEQKYELSCTRNDGTTTSAELEMRSYFKHDLMHFIVEKLAHAQYGFFGQVERGKYIEDLSPKALKAEGRPMNSQEQALEIIVSSLQKTHPTDTDIEVFVNQLNDYFSQLSLTPPTFFTTNFVMRALKDFDELLRRWHTLRHGGILTVTF